MRRGRGTPAVVSSGRPIELPPKIVKLIDEYQQCREQARIGRKAEERVTELAENLGRIFGTSRLGLSNGKKKRAFVCLPKSRHCKPLPAREFTWLEIEEIEPFEIP